MTPDELAVACRKLYGDQWQTALARDVGVIPRTVRHWAAGKRQVPDYIPAFLCARAAERIDEIADLTLGAK